MIVRCLLCHAENVEVSERISVSELAGLYGKMLSESIREEFEGHKEISFYQCGECDLRFFFPTITGSEAFYEQLQRFDWYYLQEKDEYNFAARFIAEGDSVLEIGCGRGAFAKKIMAGDYTGIEFSGKARSRAQEEGFHIIKETIQDHAKTNGRKYNVVCSFQVLEHVADVNGFLKDSVECLKPGGLLIISVPSADSFVSRVTNGILNMPPHHVTWWSDRCLGAISEMFGLDMVELDHEILADIHKDWYAATLTLNALNAALRRSQRLIDTSLLGRTLGRFATAVGRYYGLVLSDRNLRPRGHSVTAVYRKPGGE
ncbi:MAG: class I SAM-dependent methyltransferase [Deltaproteobacteria bacterium]|nr:class I SAM-dependent methyltransferase [Deltaproteobacteria bacterium]